MVGGLSLGIACFGALTHFTQTGRLHADYGAEPGPALLPELLLVALAGVGWLLILRALLARRSGTSAAQLKTSESLVAVDESSLPARALAVLAATIGFAVLQVFVGFGVAAIVLGATLCAALGWSEGRSLLRSIVEGVAIAGILYLVFRHLLSVPLT